MKSAEDWNQEYTHICGNDPAVHGQLLPTPQNIAFINRVQADALRHAISIAAEVDKLDYPCKAFDIARQLQDALKNLEAEALEKKR